MSIGAELGEYILQTHNTIFLKIQWGFEPPKSPLWVRQCHSLIIWSMRRWFLILQGRQGGASRSRETTENAGHEIARHEKLKDRAIVARVESGYRGATVKLLNPFCRIIRMSTLD